MTNNIEDNSVPEEILLSVDQGPSAMPNSLTAQGISLGYWSLGKALELAKSKAQELLLSADKGLSTIPTSLAIQDTSLEYWSLGKALDLAKSKAQELHLDQVASDIETWVKAHPWKTAFYAASAISLFAPEILSLPALEALGFGFVGVRAGEW